MIRVSLKEKKILKEFRVGKPFEGYPKIQINNLNFDVYLVGDETNFAIYFYLENNKEGNPDARVNVLYTPEKFPEIGKKVYRIKNIEVKDSNLRNLGIGSQLYALAKIKAKEFGGTHLCSDKRRSTGDEGSDRIWKARAEKGTAKYYPQYNRYCFIL